MKRIHWYFMVGVPLILVSITFYLVQIFIFNTIPRYNHEDTLFYFLQDLAFVPISVFLVTVIIGHLLSEREKRAMLEKLNMVIGVFFSEVGTSLIGFFNVCDPRLKELRADLRVDERWTHERFKRASGHLKSYDYTVKISSVDLEGLCEFLYEKRDSMLRLLENPVLLEHESFTKLLRAVFHLSEELSYRKDLGHLADSDLDHLTGDLRRVYVLLISEWLDYMEYLKDNHPFLFSLAVRMNPWYGEASPAIRPQIKVVSPQSARQASGGPKD